MTELEGGSEVKIRGGSRGAWFALVGESWGKGTEGTRRCFLYEEELSTAVVQEEPGWEARRGCDDGTVIRRLAVGIEALLTSELHDIN